MAKTYTKKAGGNFDPTTFNQDVTGRDGGVYSADQVRIILDYHWLESKNTYWRTHLFTELHLRNAIDLMSGDVPQSYLKQHREQS